MTLLEHVDVLSIRAKQEGWCVYEDHCLLRLIYDYAVGDDWRKHVKAPAHKNLTPSQLKRAYFIIDKLYTCNKYYVDLLQFASLKWRGKL